MAELRAGEAPRPTPGGSPGALALGPLAEELASTALSLARCFAAGATMWCCSPEWPAHANHVAVEFVHPVIMGKRALPAVMVPGVDVVGSLRPVVRSGDILLGVGSAAEKGLEQAMRRGAVWGLRTVWVGFGPRPAPGSADHLLWLADQDPLVPFRGRLILVYHLLWELTHVCFEHPGLLRDADGTDCEDEVCITCSDEGRVSEVIELGNGQEALVRNANGTERVDLSLVGPAQPGSVVLVHAGTAIAMLEGPPA